MPNLDLKIEGIKKEMKVDVEGVITFTISAVARIVGVGRSTLIEAFSADRNPVHQLALILIAKGFNVIDFSTKGVPDLAVSIIADYYAFEVSEKYRKDEAVTACRVFSAIGVRKWGQEVLGWKPPVQPVNSQVLILLESLVTNVTELRQEVNTQNQRIELLLPSHEMMQEIKPALLLNEGTVLTVMKRISQNLKDFPDQKQYDIRYFLQGRNCSLGERISIGQTVSGCFKGCIGQELPTKYGYKRGNKLYPECAKPIFELVLKGMGK